MSSAAGLGQVQLGMERDRVSLPRDSMVSWGTPGLCGKLRSPRWAVTGGCGRTLGSVPFLGDGCAILSVAFFPPRTSSTASTRVLTLYHRESDPEEEDEEEEELPPKSDTFVNEAYDGKEVSSISSRSW